MDRAAAIVTDAGSTTGHMASLAREFRIPALLNTRVATQAIAAGTVVTVDAGRQRVYAGDVAVRLAPARAREGDGAEARGATGASRDPAGRLLEEAARLILPLHLTDPSAADFAPAGCRTLHDLARYVHEKSYEEMFRMGADLGDMRQTSVQLDVFLPVDLYIIDLGGGLAPEVTGRKVQPAQVTSVPLKALLAGMLDRRLPRFGPRPMDARGLATVMMRHAFEAPEQERTFRDPCYALVSDRYLNYTARVGYHFGVVDSYCGQTLNKNYITLQFRGGAADLVRRSRRTRAIAGVLRRSGWRIEVKDDAVSARFSKAGQRETAAQLELVGRLLQFVRQMDVAMATESAVERVQEAFLSGDYSLAGLVPGRRDGDD
jgi:pyruvate,water dikinase